MKKYQKRFQYFNNRGGLNSKSNPMSMPLEDSPDLLNVDLAQTGMIQKRTGWRQYSSAALGAGGRITGIFRLVKTTGTPYTIIGEGGHFWEEDPAGVFTTSRAAGLHATNIWSGVGYNDYLYLANGHDPVQAYVGGAAVVTLASLGATLPPAWVGTDQPAGLQMCHHYQSERVAAWGVASDPSRVWFSPLQDPAGDWTVDGFNVLVLNDNSEMVRAVYPLYSLILIFKETETAVYSGDSVDTISLQQVYPVGCSSHRSIVQVGRDLYFWSDQGPARASGIEQFGDIAPINLSSKIEKEVAACNWNAVDQVVAVHDKENHKILWFYPSTGGTTNTNCLVFHYDVGAWTVYDGITAHSALAYDYSGGETRILFGGYDGFINESDDSYSDGDAVYDSRYITPWYDFEDFSLRKRVLEALFAYQDAFDVDVYYQWDFAGDWILIGNLRDYISGEAAIWDEVDWGDFIWGEGLTGIAKLRVLGSGKAIRFKLENTTVDTSFKLLGWSLAVAQRGLR